MVNLHGKFIEKKFWYLLSRHGPVTDKEKKQPLARTRVVGKLAKGVIVKRDLRLLKN